MPVGRGDHDHRRTGSLRRRDAGHRVLEHEAFLGREAQPRGAEQEAVGGRLAAIDVLGGDQDRRQGQAGGREPQLGQFARRRRDDGPAVGGQGGEEGRGAGDGVDPVDVVHLDPRDRGGFGLGVDAGQRQPPDRLDRADAVDGGQERLGIEPWRRAQSVQTRSAEAIELRIVPSMSNRNAANWRSGNRDRSVNGWLQAGRVARTLH